MSRQGRFLSIFCILFSLTFVPSVPHAAAKVTVENIRHRSSQGSARIVVDLSGNTEYEYKRLNAPDRVYLDFKASRVSKKVKKELRFSTGLLKCVRASQYKRDVVRVVLDMGNVDKYEIFELTEPYRVVIDVFGSKQRFNTRRVVIDAGHGGKDPGAIGSGGVKEKDVVLDIANRLKRMLEREKGYEILMTRSNDTYMNLEKRTVYANSKRADLFVSIHVNAHRNKRVRGLETYLLNWTDDAEAMRVAARENKITFKRMRQARSELGLILASLQLQNKRDESLKLAHYVQDSMVYSVDRRYKSVVDLGVKQALFYVLVGAEMPSVLVETAFITNQSDARRLKSRQYRQHLAKGIASGIKDYFKDLHPVQTVARR
jgi:N-acetylmuramoyl-L-alanine amidase